MSNNNDNNRYSSKNNRQPTHRAYNADEMQRDMILRRRAEKEKRRRMLRRNRIIFRTVFVLVIVAILFFVIKIFTSKNNGTNPKSTPGTSTPATSQSQASSVQTSTSLPESTLPQTSQPSSQSLQSIAAGATAQDWNMILANANTPIAQGYVPAVVKVNNNGHEFDVRAAEFLKMMIADGNATGLKLMICSAYRSTERQTKLFNDMKADYMAKGMSEEEAYAKTKTIRAVPGTSEHETGLAADIVSVDAQSLEETFENTPEFAWLSENAAKYGFILRYPREKQSITGIIYEPWHYRFVGAEIAKDMKEKKMCLEEYLETKK